MDSTWTDRFRGIDRLYGDGALAALARTHVAVIGLGGREEVVSPQAIRTRAARWPAARLAEYPDGHHELLMETPAIADAFMAEVLALFAKA